METEVEQMPEIDMRALRVFHRRKTMFVPLPRALWRPADTCRCRYCTDNENNPQPAYWDTMAIGKKAKDKTGWEHTWMVHCPELHFVKPKRLDNGAKLER